MGHETRTEGAREVCPRGVSEQGGFADDQDCPRSRRCIERPAEGPLTLHVRLLSVADLDPAQVLAWRDLVSRAAEPNPFFEPDYLIPAARYRGVNPTLLTVSEGRDMVACLPLYGHERRFHLPVWGVPNVLGIPHVDPEYADPGLRTAIEVLSAHWGFRRMLFLRRVPAEGTVGPALLAAVHGLRLPSPKQEPSMCPVLRRRPSPTYLDDTLKGKRRYNLGRSRRHLERLLGQPLRIVERSDEPAVIEKFLALEAAGWKGRAGTAMTSNSGESDFFRAVCSNFANANRLRMFSLEAGGTTVAMKCDVVCGDGLFNLKSTYDEQFARFSPGVLLEIEAVCCSTTAPLRG